MHQFALLWQQACLAQPQVTQCGAHFIFRMHVGLRTSPAYNMQLLPHCTSLMLYCVSLMLASISCWLHFQHAIARCFMFCSACVLSYALRAHASHVHVSHPYAALCQRCCIGPAVALQCQSFKLPVMLTGLATTSSKSVEHFSSPHMVAYYLAIAFLAIKCCTAVDICVRGAQCIGAQAQQGKTGKCEPNGKVDMSTATPVATPDAPAVATPTATPAATPVATPTPTPSKVLHRPRAQWMHVCECQNLLISSDVLLMTRD